MCPASEQVSSSLFYGTDASVGSVLEAEEGASSVGGIQDRPSSSLGAFLIWVCWVCLDTVEFHIVDETFLKGTSLDKLIKIFQLGFNQEIVNLVNMWTTMYPTKL